jgi:hypothetical protein
MLNVTVEYAHVSKTTLEIHTKVVAQNVFLILIAAEIEPALNTNVLIHVPELVAIMQSVKL